MLKTALTTSFRSLTSYNKHNVYSISRAYSGTSGKTTNEEPNRTKNELNKEKEKNLNNESESPISNAPNWSEPLASASEAIVRSERERPKTIKNLQKETIKNSKRS
eukprot:TRINITY_DN7610_c0_g1_i1.p1 TRINITY_DN7610_c0_g1~~TRINITY_DN7610_c0_g1_i1.p1  ORF type:complete len:106 (-),score=12.08 TRINITY_DN7610_c0_g1_i1:34-351(-)